MPDLDAVWNRAPDQPAQRWRRFTASLPMRMALFAVAAVWVLGAVWSFQEQSAFATAEGFAFPHLLPLVIDGFAIAMAGVAWAASLDARPAVAARLATVVAVGASSASNGTWAYLRSNHDLVAVLLGVAVPLAANLAFEVLLAELRRQVQRRRGLPPPVAVPYPRLIRLLLAPFRTFGEWRRLVLELTAMEHSVAPRRPVPVAGGEPKPVEPVRVGPALPVRIAATEPATAAGAAPWRVSVAEPPPTAPSRAEPPPTAPAPVPEPPVRQLEPEVRQPEPAVSTPGPADPAPETAVIGTEPKGAGTRPVPSEPVPGVREALARATTSRPSPGSATPGSRRPAATVRRPGPVRAEQPRPPDGDEPASMTGPGDRTGRAPMNSRVELLARHLAASEDTGEITGEMVGPLLGIDVSPRTGRRLLGQARDLVSEWARAEAEEPDRGLRVIGSR